MPGRPPKPYRVEAGGILLHIRLTPKGGRDSIDGVVVGADDRAALCARVRAVPENGEANAALIALLAKALQAKKSALTIASGASARQKTVRISGDSAEILSTLEPLCRG